MSVVGTILIVLLVLIVLLAVGGVLAAGRRGRSDEARLREQVQLADRHLAQAHAEDKGWRRDMLEAAARAAAAERFGSTAIDDLTLVQVIDRPGTDADQAVFRVTTADGSHTITLGRRDGAWIAA